MRRHPRPRIVAPLLSLLVTSSVLASAAAAAAAPVARRYIAILTTDTKVCPMVPKWGWTPLFDLKKDSLREDRGYTALKRFCRYQWVGGGNGPKTPPKSAKFMRVDPDYDVLVPQGSLAQDTEVRDALNQIYRVMLDLGPIEHATTQRLYTSADQGNVAKVAVIDTAGGPGELPGRAKHGRAMAEIIHEVRCPKREEACRSHLSFYNAFPWQGGSSRALPETAAALTDSSLEPLGGLGSLSEQIYLAVSQWRAKNLRNNTDAPLILNLSLGWDAGPWAPGDWGLPPWDIAPHQGDENLVLRQEWPATAQAVHAALVYASCFDALVIAAAGNSTRGAEVQTGALAPGKWEKLLAPPETTCKLLFGEEVGRARRPGHPSIAAGRSPLVYAVRARMTGNGNALPTSRKGSTSLQISPASFVVVGAGGSRTEPWSGSSVAAATYSGLAAALWSYDRRLTPHQVMALIYETGERSTTLYPGKPIFFYSRLLQGGTVEAPVSGDQDRAASLNPFGAFKKLCPTGCGYGGPSAPYNPYTKTPNDNDDYRWYGPLKRALAGKMDSFISLSLGGPSLQQTVYTPDDRTHFYPEWTVAPLAESAEAEPWTRPQPQTPICPFCPVTGTTLSISLDDVPDELKQGGNVWLKNPVLEFNLGEEHGFVAVSLGDLLVTSKGLKIPLNRYKILLDGVTKGFGDAIVESNVGAGSLTIFLKDSATGELRANISVVQVLPQS